MEKTYNQRLFGTPFLRYLHEARFIWVAKAISSHYIDSKLRIIELGCLDARILKYISPSRVDHYYGVDAGWDGYTNKAITKYEDNNNINFLISTDVKKISDSNEIDIAIAMQVFEYIPRNQYKQYFQKLAQIGCKNLYITVSNERGYFMVVKFLLKRIMGKKVASYSLKDLWYLLTGSMDKIERNDGSMKGFDYNALLEKVKENYIITEVIGLPFAWLPLAFNFTIAIHARSKPLS